MKPVGLDDSRKSLEVVLISKIVMVVIGGGGPPQSTRVMVDFIYPFFWIKKTSPIGMSVF